MKKIIAAGILFAAVTVSYANTCPSRNDVFIEHNGKVQVVAPYGWHVERDERKTSAHLNFSVAAWGDHLHNTDPVRCHYYSSYQDHVQLNSDNMFPESDFANHTNWTGIGNGHYYLCSNVGDESHCAFG